MREKIAFSCTPDALLNLHKKVKNENSDREEVERMTDEARELMRAYKREWNRKNPDKVRKHQATYWEKKARELKERQAEEQLSESKA